MIRNKMKHLELCFALLWIVSAKETNNVLKNYYVSVEGSDDWDGSSSENIPFTNTGPWLTIKHAIEQLRKIRPSKPSHEDKTTLNIMAGTHYQQNILHLDNRDSFIDIISHNDDDVSISGGLPLHVTWNKHDQVKSTVFSGTCPDEAFYGSYRLLPARSPNIRWNPNTNIAGEPYHIITDVLVETDTCTRDSKKFSQSCPDENRNGFIFTDGLSEDWDHLNQTKILIFHSWIAEYAKVDNITEENGRKKVMFQQPLKHYPIGTWCKPSGWRFIPFNNLALLDEPGEYVCVEENGKAKFSFIPPGDVQEGIPIISNLVRILDMNGITNMNIRGIKFEHSSSEGHDGYRYGAENAIKIVNGADITIKDCQFSHIGMNGVFLRNSSRILIHNNLFFDIGYTGIAMSYENSITEIQEDIMIKHNLFNGCGISRYWQPGCLIIAGKNNISVINNEITNVPYHSLAVRGLMDHGDKYWEENGITEPSNKDYVFHIEFNHLHGYGLGILYDFGAVYIGTHTIRCHESPEEEVRKYCYTYTHVYNNHIHGGKSFLGGAAYMYSDSGSCRNTFEKNLLNGDYGAIYHHCGLDNWSKNNYFHRRLNDHIWGGCEKGSTGLQNYTNFHNIYFLDNADNLTFGRRHDRFYNEAPNFHNNLYWSQQIGDENMPLFPDKLNWVEWTNAGNDSASLWADPLFINPYLGEYLLAEDSPAWNLGIEQIQLDNFGIQTQLKYRIH